MLRLFAYSGGTVAMAQFYAQDLDEERRISSSVTDTPITITGVSVDGKIKAFTGVVKWIEIGQTRFPGYPLRITMPNGTVK
jgi:hypothetical protein